MRRSSAQWSLVLVTAALLGGSGLASIGSFGSLEISTEPGASILWDGVDLGDADESGRVSISGIPLGRYEIAVVGDGFETLVVEIDIAAEHQAFAASLVALPTTVERDDSALPDPFAPRTSFFGIFLSVAILLAVAAVVFFLRRHRQAQLEEVALELVDGSRPAFGQSRVARRRNPEFYEDLRKRETTLESFEDRAPDRPAPKVIEIPVPDRHSTEGDR